MGLTTAGVFIKLDNPQDFIHEKIAAFFFEDIMSIKDNCPSFFDFRHPYQIIIDIFENGICIRNSDFVNKIIVKRDKQHIAKIYEYFGHPKTILAYMHYDSGDSFGFCYVKNGNVKRFRYSLSTDWVTCDYGNPLDEEIDILNAPISFEIIDKEHRDNDGDEYRYYSYTAAGETNNRSYHFINSHLASVVMKAKIGYDFYEEDDVKSKAKYVTLYTLKPNL
jgi:hypothetical protein